VEVCEGVHQMVLSCKTVEVCEGVHQMVLSFPPYEEFIVEQQLARQFPDPLQIIDNIKCRVHSVMENPDVFWHPLFAGIMEGILSEYSMMQEESVPRRRTKSRSLQE